MVRDLEVKPEMHASAGVPPSVVVNPDGEGWTDVLEDPDPARQSCPGRHRYRFGGRVPLPEPVGTAFGTSRSVRYPAEG
ncbi:hypothetical protein LO771_25395 [Streptacidiphilus sp. ASG 303]|uniref:hypothetical protein n=1 Tax=Streptacidiphilus sp. ASG 303 TaxID=2896847 RepID=UPI001E5912C5|nr:hypothetical protein [Streptacidiphilus sp. ASG 303]MCD0485632.1 hypothetical protein [Streptacidiphilus sp. ASG 303]